MNGRQTNELFKRYHRVAGTSEGSRRGRVVLANLAEKIRSAPPSDSSVDFSGVPEEDFLVVTAMCAAGLDSVAPPPAQRAGLLRKFIAADRPGWYWTAVHAALVEMAGSDQDRQRYPNFFRQMVTASLGKGDLDGLLRRLTGPRLLSDAQANAVRESLPENPTSEEMFEAVCQVFPMETGQLELLRLVRFAVVQDLRLGPLVDYLHDQGHVSGAQRRSLAASANTIDAIVTARRLGLLPAAANLERHARQARGQASKSQDFVSR